MGPWAEYTREAHLLWLYIGHKGGVTSTCVEAVAPYVSSAYTTLTPDSDRRTDDGDKTDVSCPYSGGKARKMWEVSCTYCKASAMSYATDT